MTVLARLAVLLPLVLSIVGLIISALSLFAGHREGFMEDYAIARLNVSRFGHSVIDGASGNSGQDNYDGGFLDQTRNALDEAKSDVINEINHIIGDVAGDIVEEIGISDWYSIHVMDACEGHYKPDSLADNVSLNISDCTNSQAGFRLNLTEVLNQELEVGPFEIGLNDLGWSSDIQDKIDALNDALLGLFILYVLSMGFSGVSLCTSAVAFLLPDRKSMALVNLIVTTLAALSLVIASIIVTVAIGKGVTEINEAGEAIGVNVEAGTKFLILSWVGAGVMLAAMIFWTTKFCIMKRQLGRIVRPHKMAY